MSTLDSYIPITISEAFVIMVRSDQLEVPETAELLARCRAIVAESTEVQS